MRVTLLILLSTFFVLTWAGVADTDAAFWAPTAAAVAAVALLRRAARNSPAPLSEPVGRWRLAGRVLALAVLTYLSTSLVAGIVGGFTPVEPPGGSPDNAIAVSLRLGTTVQLPITLILTFAVGLRSATWLTVKRPLRWLAMIAVTPALITLALRPVAIAWARDNGSTPPRDLAELAPRMVAVTVLIFCALALGNLYRRRSPIQSGARHASTGEIATSDRIVA
ncbi:hypothetical protein [Catellatospora sp. NPDC049133]|uniref:hypothetical protein n=1 Tax=Catellatospora sp. NPDC049133 TaxID=3155499 RepID=UPI0033DB8169